MASGWRAALDEMALQRRSRRISQTVIFIGLGKISRGDWDIGRTSKALAMSRTRSRREGGNPSSRGQENKYETS